MSWFPAFGEPVTTGDGRAWTAEFDSYDQRLDTVYYIVRLHAAGTVTRLVVAVWIDPRLDDWGGEAFVKYLRTELDRVARTGAGNTAYPGYGHAGAAERQPASGGSAEAAGVECDGLVDG